MVPSLVYGFFEKERSGKIIREKLEQYGIKPGPQLKKIKEGKDYILPNGGKVSAQELMGPKRPGRKIIYTGDTRPSQEILDFCRGADLLIHDGTFTQEHFQKASEGGFSIFKWLLFYLGGKEYSQ